MALRDLVAGNWKMNGLGQDLGEIEELASGGPYDCDVLICPPATLISRAVAVSGPVAIGAQDCHASEKGAHTGDIAPSMLIEAGATHVIVGHSERRADHHETDAIVHAKATAALAAGLVTIVCVGETLAERENGQTLDVIGAQLAGSVPAQTQAGELVIAYEPVWAIGTGKVPTLAEIGEVHDFIRTTLGASHGANLADVTRILYGGSVKPSNAAEIFAIRNVDGALVGGASLKASDFSGIIAATGK